MTWLTRSIPAWWLALAAMAHAEEHLTHGRFDDVAIYAPPGTTEQFVLWLDGDRGPLTDAPPMLRALLDQDVLVARISVPDLLDDLAADGSDCVSPDGDLENLAHYVQGYAKLSGYYAPLLIGNGDGAAFAYAVLAQAAPGVFGGAVSVGFCPVVHIAKPLCGGENLRFETIGGELRLRPSEKIGGEWLVLQGAQDHVCGVDDTRAFVDGVHDAQLFVVPDVGHDLAGSLDWLPQYLNAYDDVAAAGGGRLTVDPPPALTDLPIVEVPATGDGDAFAVLLTGDGGWAGLDKNVSASLAKRGVPVAGLDSLRYFWTARTPDGLGADLDRIVRYYAATWHKSRVLLIGYSQGADVLPFAVNRLPSATRSRIAGTVLLGPGEKASFEFHARRWFGGGDDDDALPILPEALKLDGKTTRCLYGSDDEDALCPSIPAEHARAEQLPGGHHFGGAYDKLAARILASLDE
jgi:type IV secretory pathway VirJ component